MKLHTINKQVYDFTYHSETTATTTQKQLQNYFADKVNASLSAVLDECFNQENYHFFEKIEIDLGNINGEDLFSEQLFNQLKKLLREQLLHSNKHAADSTQPQSTVEWIAMNEFLTTGYLPWWMDKSKTASLKEWAQKILHEHPEYLFELAEQNTEPERILHRITELYKADRNTKKHAKTEPFANNKNKSVKVQRHQDVLLKQQLKSELFRYFNERYTLDDASLKIQLIASIQGCAFNLNKLSERVIKQLSTILSGEKNETKQLKEKQLARRLLLKKSIERKFILLAMQLFNPEECAALLASLDTAKNRRQYKNVLFYFNRLTIYQLDFLLILSELILENDIQRVAPISHQTVGPFSIDNIDNFNIVKGERIDTPHKVPFNDKTSVSALIKLKNTQKETFYHAEDNITTSVSESNAPKGSQGNISNNTETANVSALVKLESTHEEKFNHAKYSIIKSSSELNALKGLQENTSNNTKDSCTKEDHTTPGFHTKQITTDKSKIITEYIFNSLTEQQIVKEENLLEGATQNNTGVKTESNNPLQQSDTDLMLPKGSSDESIRHKLKTGQRKTEQEVLISAKESIGKQASFNRESLNDYLIEKVSINNLQLYELLNQLPEKALLSLAHQFKQTEKESAFYRKIINQVIHHNYFFKYNLLLLLVNTEIGVPGNINEDKIEQKTPAKIALKSCTFILKEVRELQKQTAEIIRRLSFNETVMLRDILKKRDVSSKPEHKLIRKLISQLPQKAISFLYGLTELNEEDTASIFQPLQKHSYVHSRDSSISENYISSGNKFYIDNGGLCLLAPYLPNLFSNLKLLENKKFKSIIAAQKATHLLEYMCCGEKEFPEYQLQFNKILCGFNITDPLYGKIRLSRKDIHEANALLESVINNWPALKHTSVEGLQNTFLKRKAILTNEEQYWVLQVEQKGCDVLLNTVLWGFNIIHFPWMQKYITVEW